MKKQYEKPSMSIDMFEANEYIAACYKIYCSVPGTGSLWDESNGQPGLQTRGRNPDKKLAGDYLSACNRWHKGVIQGSDPSANGYWRQTNGAVTDVFCWKERLGSSSDYHATTLNKVNWETNPNAS